MNTEFDKMYKTWRNDKNDNILTSDKMDKT